ncbi:MAG: AAA family ATPase [Anaerolineae bacterium]|jgi:DNA replication protein DnaC|nr:AAA family ATPase [Anaerolineae bacterium]
MDGNANTEKAGQCPKCKGKGFVLKDVNYGHPDFGKLIPCDLCNGSRAEVSPFMELEVPKDVRGATFKNVFRRSEIAPALEVAEPLVAQRHGLLTLWGPPGVGKSEVLGCVWNEASSAGIPCLYADAIRLFARLREGLDPGANPSFTEMWKPVLNVPVLCVDDIHAVNKTGWVWERVTELICWRYEHRHDLLTCLATNESPDALPDFLRSRICDRQCRVVEVVGPDVRQRIR